VTATLLRPRALDAALALAAPQRVGVVTSAVGLGLTVAGLDARIGEVVLVGHEGGPQTAVEVVATDVTGVSAACRSGA
jgi:flagellum-specific ATP synthase